MLVACDIASLKPSKVVFGSVWTSHSSGELDKFISEVMKLRILDKCWGSFEWKKSKNDHFLPTYEKFIEIFFSSDVSYSCLVVDKDVFKSRGKHMGSNLSDAIPDFSVLHLSRRVSKYCSRGNNLTVLLDRGEHQKHILRVKTELERYTRFNLPETEISINDVQEIDSKKISCVQLCDILTGAVSKQVNGTRTSDANKHLVQMIEQRLGRALSAPTWPSEKKFNVWHWAPRY